MNKLLSSIATLCILASSSLYAKQQKWPFVCKQPDLEKFGADRYFRVAASSTIPLFLADTKTIKIDEKNKTIKVWITFLLPPGEFYGYLKILYIIDYANMREKELADAWYKCNGNIFTSRDEINEQWKETIPESSMERIINSIMQKYNLK